MLVFEQNATACCKIDVSKEIAINHNESNLQILCEPTVYVTEAFF